MNFVATSMPAGIIPASSSSKRIRVAIDLTALLPEATGVDVSLLGLVRELIAGDPENHYTFLVNREDRDRFGDQLPPNIVLRICCTRSRVVRGFVQQAWLPRELASGAYDVLHSPSFLMPLWRGGAAGKRVKHLLTVHDLTFFSMPEVHSRLRRSSVFRKAVSASIQRADLINVPSNAVRRELLRYFPGLAPESIRVTPFGINGRFSPAAEDEVARHVRRMGMPQPYVLHVGTIEPRKNLSMLLEGFRRFIRSSERPFHLVLAGGKGWDSEEIYRQAASAELAGRVHFPGHVSDEDLPWIYRGASVFAYPSHCEGFGFPPLEAMACGVAVITSEGSALEENLRGAATLVPPSDPDALSEALTRLLTDDGARREQVLRGVDRARQFQWSRTARLMVDCYRELASAVLCQRVP